MYPQLERKQALNHNPADFNHYKQISTKESPATIKGTGLYFHDNFEMQYFHDNCCSDLADDPRIFSEMIWARCLAGCLLQFVSNTMKSKPLVTTASSVCLQPR